MPSLTFIALLLATAQPATAPAPAPVPPPPRRIARILERSQGVSAETAYRVRSVREEYEVVQALGLQVRMQALVMANRRPYDVLTAVDPRTGEERRLWFDISSFFGAGLID